MSKKINISNINFSDNIFIIFLTFKIKMFLIYLKIFKKKLIKPDTGG
jgi:hypothetical protein